MVVAVEMMVTKTEWGTWEELLLAGAVLRHGSGDWGLVSGELRSRSLFPENFSPQTCEAKYEDLKRRYSGRKGWFEELKKKRMAELKAALQKSEDSIGSLETKLQNLKAERNDECQIDYDSSRTLSAEPCQKSEGAECTSKDTSKDLSSAGSVTQQAQTTNWSPETKLEAPVIEQDKNLRNDKVVEAVYCGQVLPSMRKRRGKRKRKDVKEVGAFESNLLDSSADVTSVSTCKETSTSNAGPTGGSDGPSSQTRGHSALVPDELMRIYDAIAQNECASVFRRRLDSQKRGRYKKLVRRHMDFDTIQSRISGCLVTSAKELFRDLLLVANNASIFYSKSTREHKSAVCLRDIVTESLKQYLMEDHHTTKPKVSTVASKQTSSARKPRTALPPRTRFGKATTAQDVIKTASGGKRTFGVDSPPPVKPAAAAKKGSAASGTRRNESRQTNQRMDRNASTGRKRGRVR